MGVIYQALQAELGRNPSLRLLVEELHQSAAKEFWQKTLAVLQQFLPQLTEYQGLTGPMDLGAEVSMVTPPLSGVLLTNHPYLSHGLLAPVTVPHEIETWIFSSSQSTLFPIGAAPIALDQVIPIVDDSTDEEWFLVLLTEFFHIAVVTANHSCLWSLHPAPIGKILGILQERITAKYQEVLLADHLERYPLKVPEYWVMAKLGTLLMTHTTQPELPIPDLQEVDIIRAITHEVRTPLTTIRMLVRSMKRRKDVTNEIKQRLDKIDAECTEQIERFNLIFEAAQLDSDTIPLEATSIREILQDSLTRWEGQVARRHLSLSMELPADLPLILSNGQLLTQVLSGLVDRLARSFPSDSHIQVSVAAAGDYLKIQFISQIDHKSQVSGELPLLQAVGQWLMLQPETGTVSLSLPTTKTLLQALGGKLTVRLHSHRAAYDGEILTIFLPFF
ncbi:MAG: sensor histidine kinase [Pseudanabaenaceae cyanobacterium]